LIVPADAERKNEECSGESGFDRADCNVHENTPGDFGGEQDVRFHEGTCHATVKKMKVKRTEREMKKLKKVGRMKKGMKMRVRMRVRMRVKMMMEKVKMEMVKKVKS
jgi:hypothetical protein